ncbi:Abi family protein [Macrococcus capreoli]
MEKNYTSFKKRLEILRDRGMDIPKDNSKQRDIIKKYNYYSLINGYKKPFLEDKNNYPKGVPTNEDYFIQGTTPEHLETLLKFDDNIRNIFLQKILKIEEQLKHVIVQSFYEYHTDNSSKKSIVNVLHRESEYLRRNYYDLTSLETFHITEKSQYRYTVFSYIPYDDTMKIKPKAHKVNKSDIYDKLIARIYSEIGRQRRKSKYISSYLDNHTYLPLWVLTNILTFGQIGKLYDIQKRDIQELIIEKLGFKSNANTIDMNIVNTSRIINILTIYRNLCAHNERMYCEKILIPIDDDFMNYLEKFPQASDVKKIKNSNKHLNHTKAKNLQEYRQGLYTLIFCISLFLSKGELDKLKRDINKELTNLQKKLNSRAFQNVLNLMGLDFDWEKSMTK